jgi:RHS repeat-associated protein
MKGLNCIYKRYTYELSNHLGNVLSVISDKVIPHPSGGSVAYYKADIMQAMDYSPFGVTLKGRNLKKTGLADEFRFGFNGMEADDEMKGDGNSYDFGARILDPRLGRWFTIDPSVEKYPSFSSYNFVMNSPLLYDDPTGESGEVTINRKTKTVTVTSHMIFYGSASSPELASSTAKDIQNLWNGAKGKVVINGVKYKVKFVVTGEHRSDLTPKEVANNKDYKNNYVRIEKSNLVGVSYYDSYGAGGNTGYFVKKNIEADGSTTEAHEWGHGVGLVKGTVDAHPVDSDLRGKGQPGIMSARGTIVDKQYQYDVNAEPGAVGGTINPEKRKVLQSDIDMLELDKLNYVNDKANLGVLTNEYHQSETAEAILKRGMKAASKAVKKVIKS